MDRAEAMKKKCNFIVVDKEDLSSIESAYEIIDEANNLVKTGDLKQAFDEYNKGIEIAVKLLSKLKGNDKTSLYAELDQWISKAESIKKQLKTSDNRKNKKKISKKEKFNKTSNENKELLNNNDNEKEESISFSNFISNTLNSKDLRFSPTCYVQ
jgi:Ca2+-binding EF-hand superfamily protein